MKRASQCVNDEQRGRINKAVGRAESTTEAEIVPVLATDSGRYDRAEDIAGLVTGIVTLVVAWLAFQREDPAAGGWDGLPIALQLPALIIIIIVGFIAGALITARLAWLRRLFTPRDQMQDEVSRRAREVFFDQRIHHTSDASGLLIYVSLFERTAVLLADEHVLKALGQPALDTMCGDLTGALRRDEPAEAIRAAVERAGKQLADALPRPAGDTNELPNALVTFD